MNRFIICLFCILFVGCTDGFYKRFAVLGDPAKITCYSGGKVIYEGTSTGKVGAEEQSDGWYFEDADTHKLVRVSGDCVIVN
jgi:hypothetical protein